MAAAVEIVPAVINLAPTPDHAAGTRAHIITVSSIVIEPSGEHTAVSIQSLDFAA